MQQPSKRYQELADKWMKGIISEEEMMEFNRWYNEVGDEDISVPASFAAGEAALRQRMWQRIQEGKAHESEASVRTLQPVRRWYKLAAAAVVFFIMGTGFLYYLLQHKSPGSEPRVASLRQPAVKQPSAAGGAVLTLGDGSAIVLDASSNGDLAQQHNIKIVKLADGRLSYVPRHGTSREVMYNTLTTPKGGQYNITLSDGTKVWLNAASSLRFPAAFVAQTRVVELNGEAYFEVASNKAKPFKVKVNDMEVEVLGTHFNVNAYDDENSVNTTLLEGSVKVITGNQSKTITPAQQVAMSKSGELSVASHVNVDAVVAWKNGEFRFENTKVTAIMRQIARWYDVKIAYRGNVPDVELSGMIARKENVGQLLEILEATHKVHFQQEGNTITVMPFRKK